MRANKALKLTSAAWCRGFLHMPWSWEEIQRDWLGNGQVAVDPPQVVSAFDAVERVFGRPWIDARRFRNGLVVSGSLPTLSVISMGKLLQSLEDSRGTATLIEKIRNGDRSALAEATAAFLCAAPGAEIEFEEAVGVGDRDRKPDFRIRKDTDDWAYTEVTAPDPSESHERARTILDQLMELLPALPEDTTVDVFFRIEPSDSELAAVSSEIRGAVNDRASRDLPGVAVIAVNESVPGQIVPRDYGENPPRPRVGAARAEAIGNRSTKHISVRIPVTDERAESFIRKEARQLPTTAPGLIMIDMYAALGGVKAWEPLIRRRLQPNQHTRVGAVCLFFSTYQWTEGGENWVPETVIIENPFARLPLPEWLIARLASFRPQAAR